MEPEAQTLPVTVMDQIVRRRSATPRAVLHNALGTHGANGAHARLNSHVKLEFKQEAVNALENLDVTASDLPRNLNNAAD